MTTSWSEYAGAGQREQITAFIPGQVRNPLNQRWHWSRRHVYSKGWRDRTRLILGPLARECRWPATMPKRVILVAQVACLMDSHDNLRAALKPIIDELRLNVWTIHGYRPGLGLIVDDADRYGNVFEYQQVKAAKNDRGVAITVEPLSTSRERT